MDFLIDLQRILWHELGHLCIDIIETDENPNYQVEKLSVLFHPDAISVFKWSGSVKVLPSIKFVDLVEDEIKMPYSLINLLSGCIFQTIFLKEFEKQDVEFNVCFSFNPSSAGNGDIAQFYGIGVQYRLKFGNRVDYTKFIEIEFKETLYNQILNNKEFLIGINQVAIKYRDLVSHNFQNQEVKNNYQFTIIDEDLEVLKKEIRELMIKTDFYKLIIEVAVSIREKMIADKNQK